MYIPKLRKKEHVINEIRKLDENTCVTTYLINTLVKKGEITKIDYGNAHLINLDELADFFTSKEKQ